MDNSAYREYFESLAIKHKEILHDPESKVPAFFYTNDDEQVRQSAAGKGIKYPCMIVKPHSGKYQDQNVIKNAMYGSFEIRKKVTEATNYAEIQQAWTECYNIGQQIIAKMRLDSEEKGYSGPIPNFSLDTVRYSFTGPLSDVQYGCSFSFEFMDDAFDPYQFDDTEFFNA